MELNFTAKYCQEIRNKIINNLAEIVFPWYIMLLLGGFYISFT
jgi:hypothetical protein